MRRSYVVYENPTDYWKSTPKYVNRKTCDTKISDSKVDGPQTYPNLKLTTFQLELRVNAMLGKPGTSILNKNTGEKICMMRRLDLCEEKMNEMEHTMGRVNELVHDLSRILSYRWNASSAAYPDISSSTNTAAPSKLYSYGRL
ncbi:unnamed protein product [Heligmosomoides polygyrus]|uniref:KxDL domain-containing protein n=1 Tax=Heligmosomoides polygyrus TaxID=6339 RepID=A0A183FV40_HELPZ|nr:unnamed protein product [Heligmosomoides polygyrus]